MPSVQARQLCPQAVFVAGRHARYAEVSKQIHQVFLRYTPLVEGISLDEAFLDVTGATRLLGPAPGIATAIRERIRSELGLGCSVGVAPVKFLAKLASEAAKPRASREGLRPGCGVFVINPGGELEFLHPLPIEALWGVGPASASRLRRLGMATVGDLAGVPPEVLERALGKANGSHLARLARGVDERDVDPDREVKSISHEETYAKDRRDRRELHLELFRMADSVAARMRRAEAIGRTVTLKVRYGDFTTITRSRTSPAGFREGQSIASLASQLLDAVDVDAGVRLLGVGVSNLEPAPSWVAEQLTLDLGPDQGPGAAPPPGSATAAQSSPAPADPVTSAVPPPRRLASAAKAVDAIRDRFGDDSVGPAVLLGPDGLRIKRQSDSRWGPG
jgi:DNA polymerase-4